MEKSSLEQPHITSPDKEKEDDGSFTFEIGGIELKATKKEFEYPEHIQKETGILGYERTKISKDSLFSFYRQFYKTQYNFDFDKNQINNEADLISYIENIQPKIIKLAEEIQELKIKKARCEETLEKKDAHLDSFFNSREEWESFYKAELEKINIKIKVVESNELYKKLDDENLNNISYRNELNKELTIKYEILSTLSEGEYPGSTYNHKMGGYARDLISWDKMREDFGKDKFFIQKIYDIERINKNSQTQGTQEIFNHPESGNSSLAHSNITLYDKNTGIEVADAMHVGQLVEYEENIKSDTVFGAAIEGGFNVVPSAFFGGIDLKSVSVGFPIKLDSLHKEYLLKSLEISGRIIESNIKKDKKFINNLMGWRGQVGDIVFMLFLDKVMSDPDLSKELQSMDLPTWKGRTLPKEHVETMRRIYRKYILDLSNTEKIDICFLKDYSEVEGSEENNSTPTTALESGFLSNLRNAGSLFFEDESEKRIVFGSFSMEELSLPVFINHDEITQLAWGHANYAHYSNEKSFNFIKFKHADHLPIKDKGE